MGAVIYVHTYINMRHLHIYVIIYGLFVRCMYVCMYIFCFVCYLDAADADGEGAPVRPQRPRPAQAVPREDLEGGGPEGMVLHACSIEVCA